jgi:hypothetical protein
MKHWLPQNQTDWLLIAIMVLSFSGWVITLRQGNGT